MGDPKITIVMDAVNKTQGKMDAVGDEGERMAGKMKAVGMALVAIGAAASAALLKAVDDVKAFNRSIEETAVTAGASAKDIAKLKESALELGNAKVTADEVSKGYAVLMRVTHDAAEAMEHMGSFTDYAMATNQNLADVISNTTDVLGQFGRPLEDVHKLMDYGVVVYSNSTWKLGEYERALLEIGPAAAAAGVGLEESTALIGLMAKSSMSASQTTSSLRILFSKLVDDTAEVQDAMAELGVQTYNADGSMRGMTDIVGEVMDSFAAMEDGTDKARLAIKIFGARSGGNLPLMLSKGSEALDEFTGMLEGSKDMTKALADVAEDSISPWAKFKNSIHEVSLKFGAITEPIAGVLSFLTSMLMPVGMLMMMYPKLAAGINISTISMKLHAVAAVLSAKAQWLLNTAILGCPLVWIIALIVALVAILYLLVKHWDKVKDAVGKFAKGAKEKLGEFSSWMKDKWSKAVEGTKQAWENLKGAAEKTWEAIKAGGSKIKDWFSNNAHKWFERYEKFKEIGRKLMEALKNGMESMKNKLKDAAGNIADSIRKFFGGSLPEVGPLKHIVTMGEDLMRGYGQGMVRGSALTKADLSSALGGLVGGGVSTQNYSATLNVSGMGVMDDGQLQMLYRRLEQLELSKARRSTP